MKKYEFPLIFHTVKTLRAMLRRLRIASEGSALDHKLNASFCNQVWSFMKKDFSDVIKDYSGKEDFKVGENGGKIWMCWWQGEDAAPPLVKRCIESIRRNAGGHDVIVIDKDNMSDYIDIPTHILEKHEANIIRTVSFTDVLRVYLLAKHGGLWLDATVFCFKPIPIEIWDMPVYTFKYHSGHFTRPKTKKGSKEFAFSDNIIGGCGGHPLFCFSRDTLAQYWKKHSSLIVYGVLFFILQLAYDIIPIVQRDIDAVPINIKNRFKLHQIFDQSYDQGEIDALAKSGTHFFKLDWKKEYRKYTGAGEETVYKRFLEGTLML